MLSVLRAFYFYFYYLLIAAYCGKSTRVRRKNANRIPFAGFIKKLEGQTYCEVPDNIFFSPGTAAKVYLVDHISLTCG